MKKISFLLSLLMIIAATAAGCAETPVSTFAGEIQIVSREDGSGTRGAFVELLNIIETIDGQKVDMTYEEAIITNSTSVMITTVSGNPQGIGYISLGSMNDTVKAVNVDGVEATVENIKAGTYKVARPFNIVTMDDLSAEAQDFIDFILSSDGQAIIAEAGYIQINDEAAEYVPSNLSGKVIVEGSSSVTPAMDKLREAYVEINPNMTIELQQNDSTTGINSTISGICDIGMVSREVKESELEKGVTPTVIAMDGIAVIINNDNPLNSISSETLSEIFKGRITEWDGVEEYTPEDPDTATEDEGA